MELGIGGGKAAVDDDRELAACVEPSIPAAIFQRVVRLQLG